MSVYGREGIEHFAVHVQYCPNMPLLIEQGNDDFRIGPAVTCDVTRKLMNVRDDDGSLSLIHI
jgi:hypothetical protein